MTCYGMNMIFKLNSVTSEIFWQLSPLATGNWKLQQAFLAEKEAVPLRFSIGRVCAEFVMCYPPGIPILAPGERITEAIVSYILYAKEKGCSLTGSQDMTLSSLQVVQ